MERIKSKKPIRSYTGEVWKTNSSNKKRLAIDFEHKCAYCDDYDKYSGGYNTYHVEHFAPKEKFSHLEFIYDNLLYSCPYCNISKSNKWVGKTETENIVGNTGFVDPCTEDYYNHLYRDSSGEIKYSTSIGEYMYYEMKLYLKRHKVLYNLERVRAKKNQIKDMIVEKQKYNEDTTNLEELYRALCVIFCEYYDSFLEDE
ncbi:HNH endonuclease [Clostridium sp.]|uniref:HNH endonuclease n=1 Tax=Clostridium sp. TaxID=1506 RepID=UPI0025C619C0|nr:HNH endonuclease [Clostridium sp.]